MSNFKSPVLSFLTVLYSNKVCYDRKFSFSAPCSNVICYKLKNELKFGSWNFILIQVVVQQSEQASGAVFEATTEQPTAIDIKLED